MKNAKIIFILLGVILIIFSVLSFISDKNHKDFIKIEATVSKAELVREASYDIDGNYEDAMYKIFVKYTVDGNVYDTELGDMYEKKVGEKITIIYNPKDPTEIAQPATMVLNIVLLVGGIASLVAGIVLIIKKQ